MMKAFLSKVITGRLALIESFFIVLFLGVQTAPAALSFLSSTYAVGHSPVYVTVADVNNDGWLDLICANNDDNTLTILTNNGGGIFGSNATLNVGKGPECVIAADLRNQGQVDLICANYGSGGGRTVTVLTNNDHGSFGSNTTVTVGFGPLCLVAVDIKGSGRLDVVTSNGGTNGTGNTLTILTNNGSGLLVSNATVIVGTNPVFVVAADVNGDGRPDLISANNVSNSLSILTNRGNARFSSQVTLPVSQPSCVAAANINADGKPDLVCASLSSSVVTLFTNNGSGQFVLQTTLPMGNSLRGPIFPDALAVADFDGDGRLDVAVANFTNVTKGVGALVIFTNNANYQLGSNATINVGKFSVHVISADLNADGKPDLVSVNLLDNTLTVLINANSFPSPASTPPLSLGFKNNILNAIWPSATPGWSLMQKSDLTNANWLASGNGGFQIVDDGTNKSLVLPAYASSRFFRLMHP
ncbi:MAG: VCBS repeat-containing protein [Verrucomicrobiae bacterium]|nr:VCBS repeat-containing protein [Verrucomicrobiae bacterium]